MELFTLSDDFKVCLCTSEQILRRSLSNIKDCSTAGSDSNGPTEFTSTHRVVPPAVPGDDSVRRPSAATSVIIASAAHTPKAARPRIRRRPLNDPVPERPTTSRTIPGEVVPAGPERRSCSLDSKRSWTRQYQGLSASTLLAESASMSTNSRVIVVVVVAAAVAFCQFHCMVAIDKTIMLCPRAANECSPLLQN